MLVLGQAIHLLIDLSLGKFLLLVRTITEFAVVELHVQLLLLLGSCFYQSLLLLFLQILVVLSYPISPLLGSGLYIVVVVALEVD